MQYGQVGFQRDFCLVGWMGHVQYKVQRQMDARSLARLYEEVAFLKSSSEFTLHLKPRYLLDFYLCLPAQERPDLKRLASRIERQTTASAGKSIYIGLKWLAFQHALLQENDSPAIIERAIESISKLPTATSMGNFEQYINKQLVTPYRQYLLKLAAILLARTAEDQRLYGEGEEEGGRKGAYCMYNLISYSVQAFSGAISQFSRYFHRFFPCLNEYVGRIGKDVRQFMHRIQSEYQDGHLPMLNFLELEQLEGSLSMFDRVAQQYTNHWLLPQTNALSFQITEHDEMRTDSALQAIKISNNNQR